jgi:hypothetical protein
VRIVGADEHDLAAVPADRPRHDPLTTLASPFGTRDEV